MNDKQAVGFFNEKPLCFLFYSRNRTLTLDERGKKRRLCSRKPIPRKSIAQLKKMLSTYGPLKDIKHTIQRYLETVYTNTVNKPNYPYKRNDQQKFN